MNHTPYLSWIGASIALIQALTPALAQAPDRVARQPANRHRAAAAYDVARSRVVLFGGYGGAVPTPQFGPLDDTHEWDGRRWHRCHPTSTPPARMSHGMAYDVERERTVMFGGGDWVGVFRDTWEWDGATWTQRTPATGPSARWSPAMAYDFARRRVVLFGGFAAGSGVSLGDTWEWDGSTWTQRLPRTTPLLQYNYQMVYDVRRGTCVLVGNDGSHTTWEWDGIDWVQRSRLTTSPRPVAIRDFGLAYDVFRSRVVMFGGYGGTDSEETWEWDGFVWVRRTPARRPLARGNPAMVYDVARRRTVIFGGGLDWPSYTETWEWDGTDWFEASFVNRIGLAIADDARRGRVVLFGGSNFDNGPIALADTWEWDGFRWLRRTPTASPPARSAHVMASDDARGRVVVYGGNNFTGSRFADTWEWDGNNWLQRRPVNSPPASSRINGLAMAYDPVRRLTHLVQLESGPVVQHWVWDGNNWSQLNPPSLPTGLAAFSLSFDRARGRLVLVSTSFTTSTTTWEWDGVTWTQALPATSPPSLSGRYHLTYDGARQRTLAAGDALWEWDGNNWTWRSAESFGAIVYDSTRRRVIGVSGDQTFVLGVEPTVQRYGTGCSGRTAAPMLGCYTPFAGNESFALSIADARPAAAGAIALSTAATSMSLGSGCTLYVGQAVILPAATSRSGSALLAVAIPDLLSLRGLRLYGQCFIGDPQGPVLGLSMSAGLALALGD